MPAGNISSAFESGDLIFRSEVTGSVVAALRAASGGKNYISQRRTVVDIDAQNGTLLAASVAAGIIVHTSTTGAGTLTFDSAANYNTQFPDLQIGDVVEFDIFNDGNQTVTLAADGGATITLWDASQTLATHESCHVILLKTGAATYTAYWTGA